MNTRIRPAVVQDAPDIIGLVHRFLEGTGYGAVLPFNPDALADLILLVLESGSGCVFLGQLETAVGQWKSVAMIGGIAGPHPITGEGTVEELVWWVDPEARATSLGPKLLGCLEDWAIQNGQLVLKMVAPVGSPVGLFYQRHGYTPIETAYLKRL